MPFPLPTETLNTTFYHVFNLIRKFSKCEKNIEKTFLTRALSEGQIIVQKIGIVAVNAGHGIQKLEVDPHLILVDEANHLSVASLELLRHIHDLSHCGMVLVGTKRLYDLFTNGGRKSQDLEQLWSRVTVHDPLPGMAPSEVQAIVHSSMGHVREGVAEEIQKTSKGSIRRLTKLTTRLKRLQELNPNTPLEKLVPFAAGQIIA